MIYHEEKLNLFDVGSDYYLAQCISSDFGMGAGIAVEFNRRYDMKNKLKDLYPNGFEYERGSSCLGVILRDNVFNLVTKYKYWEKPTYESLASCLQKMREIIIKNKIEKLAMPKIGSGLDRLSWKRVSEIIQETFYGVDVEILICCL